MLAIGRTWRLGPSDAPYMIVWKIPDFARIDEWTRARREDASLGRSRDAGDALGRRHGCRRLRGDRVGDAVTDAPGSPRSTRRPTPSTAPFRRRPASPRTGASSTPGRSERGDLLVAEMDHAGVEKAFLISYDGWDMPYYMRSRRPDASRSGAAPTTAGLRRERYPDRLLWFVTLRDPRERKGLEPLERRLDEGAHGIKVFPGFLETNIDDPVLMEAYALVHERGRRVIFGFEDTNRPTTPTMHEVWEAFARVAEAFPDMPFQTNHMGYLDPRQPEAERMFEIVREHPNIYVSCSCLQFMWEDEHEYPFPPLPRADPRAARRLRRRPDRLRHRLALARALLHVSPARRVGPPACRLPHRGGESAVPARKRQALPGGGVTAQPTQLSGVLRARGCATTPRRWRASTPRTP